MASELEEAQFFMILEELMIASLDRIPQLRGLQAVGETNEGSDAKRQSGVRTNTTTRRKGGQQD